ncbi:MAG TPA: ATP-binding protein [Acidimicrobiales bacterium]
MGTVLSANTDDAARETKRHDERRGLHVPQHAAPSGRRAAPRADHEEASALARTVDTVRRYLPRGNNLDEETFHSRHLFLSWVLLLHVPALFALGAYQGFDLWHVALELVVPVACVVFARLSINRRLAAFFITAGLVYCSVVLVHLSGGMIEAHFHFFILIGLIALYQDWVPFLWNVVFTVLSHGLGSVIGSDIMFNHDAGQARPWTWAGIHGVAVLAACVGEVIFWKHTEQEQERNVQLVADLAAADAERRQAMSELLVNLARRNQSLLNRQLEVITDLEVREQEPDTLEELFRLDHLATRIRRNAESLLVLSGDDPARRWGKPVSLADVARAAAAEVEEYRRVEVLVNDHIEVTGRAVADLAHLLAELIENATTFSPPSTQVRVRSQLSPGDMHTTVVSVEDEGIGMPEDDLRTANALLEEVPEVDLGRSTMLGFHVVARLAQRYGLSVRLAPTPGGGVTAMVALPTELVSERRSSTPATVGADTGGGAYSRGAGHAGPWSGLDGASRLARINGAGGQVHLGDQVVPSAPDGLATAPAAAPPDAMPPGAIPSQPEPITFTPAPPPPEPFRPAPTPAPIPALAPAPPPAQPGGEPAIQPPDWWWQSESFLPNGSAGGTHEPAPGGDGRAGTAPDHQAGKTSVWPPQPSPHVPGPPAGPTAVGNGATPPPPAATGNGSATPTPAAFTMPPAPPQPPAGQGNDPVPAEAVLPPMGNGLVRRVPGAHLAPSLRRDNGDDNGAAEAPSPSPERDRDRDQVRSMLSKFQANQRAGRAAADAGRADPPQEKR